MDSIDKNGQFRAKFVYNFRSAQQFFSFKIIFQVVKKKRCVLINICII